MQIPNLQIKILEYLGSVPPISIDVQKGETMSLTFMPHNMCNNFEPYKKFRKQKLITLYKEIQSQKLTSV